MQPKSTDRQGPASLGLLEGRFDGFPADLLAGEPGSTSAQASRLSTLPQADCVLFLCPAYDCRYQSQTMWQRLAAISRLGPVTVLTARRAPGAELAPPRGVSITTIRERGPRMSDMLFYPHRVSEIVRTLIGGARTGLIWANSVQFTRRAAFAAARQTGWPVVLDVWDTPDLPFWSQYRERRYFKALAHRVMGMGIARDLEAADLVVWTLHPDATKRFFRPDAGKLLLLPNGFRRQQLERFGEARNSHLAPAHRKPRRLAYLGYFQRSRGSDIVIEMVDFLRKCDQEVVVDVAGDASLAPVREAMEGIPAHLRSSFCFHGHQPWEQAMDLVRDADVCLYPFPRHPELEFIYPLKLFEYAALKKCIVSSDLTGARLLLRDYPNVRFCDPRTPAQWARAVRSLLETGSRDWPSGARERFVVEHDWETLADRLVERAAMLLKPLDLGRQG